MKKSYPFISILRVLAMISIVAGHLCSYFDVYLYDLGGVGVEIFLAISGYLYGQRLIKYKAKWLYGRLMRIMIPVWIWTVFLFLLGSIIDKPHFDLLPCLIGVQGTGFLTPFNLPIYRAMSHTWFVTTILICYLFTLVLCNEKGLSFVDKYKWQITIMSCIAQIILARIGFQIGYFIIFFTGFIIARLGKSDISKRALLSFIAMFILGATRILLHGLENWFYNSVIAIWSAGAIGIFSLCFFEWLGTKWSASVEKIANLAVWKYLDKVSYPIYIVHYCFLHGFLDVANMAVNPMLQLLLCLVLTGFSAAVLEKTTEIVRKRRDDLIKTN